MDFATVEAFLKEHWIPVAITLAVFIATIIFRPGKGGKAKKGVISPTSYTTVKLSEVIKVNHNTSIFRFALPKKTDKLNLPIGKHIYLRAEIGGKNVSRPYTPISSDKEEGHVDLMIKVYPQGNMSAHVGSMAIGETIDIKGPMGQFKYQPNDYKFIGMIAGGTGVTPMLQVINAALKNPKDNTRMALIFANIAEEDILLKDRIDALADKYPEQFSVYYCLEKPPQEWDMGVGYVSESMISDHFEPHGDDVKVVLCGPPPMTKAMKGVLGNMGYNTKRGGNVFEF